MAFGSLTVQTVMMRPEYTLISQLLKQSLLFGTDEHSWDSLIIYSCVYLIDHNMLWKWSYEYDWIECSCCAGPYIPNRWAEYKIYTTSHSDYVGRITVSTTSHTDYGLGGQNTKFQQLHIRIRWAEYKVCTTLLTDYGLGGQNTKFLQLHLPIRWAASTNVFYLDSWVSCTYVHLFVSLVEFCFVFSLLTVDDG